MSKKKDRRIVIRSATRKPSAAVAAAIADAYRSSSGGGDYSAAIARRAESASNDAIAKQLAAMTLGMHKKPAEKMRSPKRKLSKAEKAAKKRVQNAIRKSAAKSARLEPKRRKKKIGKKKSSTSKKSKVVRKSAASIVKAAAAKTSKKRSTKKVRTVTADAAIKQAATTALKRWLCEGPKRTGCGRGGTRVKAASYKGPVSFTRLRPMRFMMGR